MGRNQPFRTSFFNNKNKTMKVSLNNNSSMLKVKKNKEEQVTDVTFLTDQSKPIDMELNDSSTVLETKMSSEVPVEDVYYDEIVFYDGGGVCGYGYDKAPCQGCNSI